MIQRFISNSADRFFFLVIITTMSSVPAQGSNYYPPTIFFFFFLSVSTQINTYEIERGKSITGGACSGSVKVSVEETTTLTFTKADPKAENAETTS